MAEKTLMTSSMTSVTSEDTSLDSESDTTESYSNLPSSPVSTASDYNTDDKLTPGVNNIQISNFNNNSASSKSYKDAILGLPSTSNASQENPSKKNDCPENPFKFSFGLFNPHQGKRKQKDSLMKQALFHQQTQGRKRFHNNDNLGLDDPDNLLSTDFSDTSSKVDPALNPSDSPLVDSASDSGDLVDNTEASGNSSGAPNTHTSTNSHPFLPDMTSGTWYRARCFDMYWSNYQFAMEWYHQHLKAVSMIGSHIQRSGVQKQSGKGRKSRRSSRARKRRKAKAQRSRSASQMSEFGDTENVGQNSEDVEMNITDEMMDFFKQSLKHKMERDKAKSDEGKEGHDNESTNAGQTCQGQQPSEKPPSEQPGSRRTAEMQCLYGAGAAMVHSMETALQMTFDRITDRRQPKLWPNMPLKVIFN